MAKKKTKSKKSRKGGFEVQKLIVPAIILVIALVLLVLIANGKLVAAGWLITFGLLAGGSITAMKNPGAGIGMVIFGIILAILLLVVPKMFNAVSSLASNLGGGLMGQLGLDVSEEASECKKCIALFGTECEEDLVHRAQTILDQQDEESWFGVAHERSDAIQLVQSWRLECRRSYYQNTQAWLTELGLDGESLLEAAAGKLGGFADWIVGRKESGQYNGLSVQQILDYIKGDREILCEPSGNSEARETTSEEEPAGSSGGSRGKATSPGSGKKSPASDPPPTVEKPKSKKSDAERIGM